MVKIKGVKYKKRIDMGSINIDAINRSATNYIMNHPYYSAMYHDEIMAERMFGKNRRSYWKKGVRISE